VTQKHVVESSVVVDLELGDVTGQEAGSDLRQDPDVPAKTAQRNGGAFKQFACESARLRRRE
jgi:hypothetical protein